MPHLRAIHLAGADHSQPHSLHPKCLPLRAAPATKYENLEKAHFRSRLRINSAATSATTLKCALRPSVFATTVSDVVTWSHLDSSDRIQASSPVTSPANARHLALLRVRDEK